MLFVTNVPSGILSSQTTMFACCPKPTGLGATLMKAYVGICHAGVCALAGAKEVSDIAVLSRRIIVMNVAVVLFFENCIFLFFSIFFHSPLKER